MEITLDHLIYALLSAYCLAGCLMEHLTLFCAWSFATNANDLARMQVATGTRAGIIYVLPKAIVTMLTIWFAFSGTPIAGVWFSVVSLGITWVSSFLVQVRMQLRLKASQGKDRAALERLLNTTWVRTAGMVGHCFVVGYGLFVLV